jgi:hypothetical protein
MCHGQKLDHMRALGGGHQSILKGICIHTHDVWICMAWDG